MTDRYVLILVAVVKRSLVTPATDPESQALTFRILTALDKLARHENGTLTDEAIAAIQAGLRSFCRVAYRDNEACAENAPAPLIRRNAAKISSQHAKCS